MGIPRHTEIVKPAKPKKKRAKTGSGEWVQINCRLSPGEYEIFKREASACGLTAPGMARRLIDEYMNGLNGKVERRRR